MEAKQYQKLVDDDNNVDIEDQGSYEATLLPRRLLYTGVILLLLLAIAFMIAHCWFGLFQTHANSHPYDYSQADSFYISNDPPYSFDYEDDDDNNNNQAPSISLTNDPKFLSGLG
ncbi:hypothetical protein BVRB_5g122930 [Beta vulgaris subsp. vulgaris]|uniref:Uncharacterized protein n=1 Tax=Beta vulgaris subsp. vulgaris TaxID=3555 RepID=A0A0J8BD24_BETVV|nr:hypothetical protein BVRB_5g122930 [Beta vulgaris subsp. vulgaris]